MVAWLRSLSAVFAELLGLLRQVLQDSISRNVD